MVLRFLILPGQQYGDEGWIEGTVSENVSDRGGWGPTGGCHGQNGRRGEGGTGFQSWDEEVKGTAVGPQPTVLQYRCTVTDSCHTCEHSGTYSCQITLYARNSHNIVCQLYLKKKKNMGLDY